MKGDILNFIEEKHDFFQDEIFEGKDDRRIVTDISLALMLVNKLLIEKKEKMFSVQYALSSSEFEVLLSLLAHNKCLTPTQLYENMIFSSGGMTKILHKLETKKYIKRVSSQKDKRSRLVEITPKGMELTKKVFKEIVSFNMETFGMLDDEERIFLKKILKKMLLRLTDSSL